MITGGGSFEQYRQIQQSRHEGRRSIRGLMRLKGTPYIAQPPGASFQPSMGDYADPCDIHP